MVPKRRVNYVREPTEIVELFWRPPDSLTIQSRRALYYLRPRGRTGIMYIGKAGRQSIKNRIYCPSKGWLEKIMRKEKLAMRPFVASIHTTRIVTPKLIDDIERLLIFLVQPQWNRTGKQTCRLHHRELVVECNGQWSHPRSRFSYCDDFPHSLTYGSE
jgi:hypothetical protein